jgi:hypothetical protein
VASEGSAVLFQVFVPPGFYFDKFINVKEGLQFLAAYLLWRHRQHIEQGRFSDKGNHGA